MGLLDSLFSGNAYGGQGGHLLDFLNQSVMQQNQYQPGPGFAQPPQAAPMPVGNYQMPRIGDSSQFLPNQGALPQSSQPAQGQLPAQETPSPQLPPALGGGAGSFGRLFNPDGLIARLTGNDPRSIAQQNLKAQYDSLVPVLGQQKALLAVMNPEAGKTLLTEALTNKQELKVLHEEDALGNKRDVPYWSDPRNQTFIPAQGQTQGAGSNPMAGMQLLAPGVKAYDPTLTGDDYLNQFGPEVQAAVKNWLRGEITPTSNPRMKGIIPFAKTAAMKYAQDMGIPFSDATFSEMRKYRTELGSTSAGTAGGQAKAFTQGTGHLSDLADTFLDLNNKDPFGIPRIAQWVNNFREGSSTDQKAIADKAEGIGQTLAGEVGKLFSGSSGGGVHEREMTRERFNTVKSPKELSAALEATLKTMHDGLDALEQRRDQVFRSDPGAAKEIEFVSPETTKKLQHVQDVIDQLKGKTSGGNVTKSGVQWSVVK